jgi:hypothetical protein
MGRFAPVMRGQRLWEPRLAGAFGTAGRAVTVAKDNDAACGGDLIKA